MGRSSKLCHTHYYLTKQAIFAATCQQADPRRTWRSQGIPTEIEKDRAQRLVLFYSSLLTAVHGSAPRDLERTPCRHPRGTRTFSSPFRHSRYRRPNCLRQ
jgi:hypothetical protein